MPDLTKLSFYSEMNYMKRGFSGSQEITLPAGSGAVLSTDIEHNLGYIPFFIVGAHLNDDTTIWSSNRVHQGTKSSAFGDTPVQLNYWCTDTTLTIYITNGTGVEEQSGTRTLYWAIYLDYGDE